MNHTSHSRSGSEQVSRHFRKLEKRVKAGELYVSLEAMKLMNAMNKVMDSHIIRWKPETKEALYVSKWHWSRDRMRIVCACRNMGIKRMRFKRRYIVFNVNKWIDRREWLRRIQKQLINMERITGSKNIGRRFIQVCSYLRMPILSAWQSIALSK